MHALTVFCSAALVAASLAVNCDMTQTKQDLTFPETNTFYDAKLWADIANPEEPRDAFEGSGRSIFMSKNGCYRVKAAEPADLIKVCASTKFADKVSFHYNDGTGFQQGAKYTQNDPSEFSERCFRVKDFFPVNVLANIESVQVCFERASGSDIKLKNVQVTMCD